MRHRVGIDGHMMTGKHQGSRTFVRRLLHGLHDEGLDQNVVLFSEDPDTVRTEFPQLEHALIASGSSLSRVFLKFPKALAKADVDTGVFQYILPPFFKGSGVVFIHDVLPLTHRHLFPFAVTARRWLFTEATIRKASIVFTISQATADAIVRIYPSAAPKVRVLLLGPSFDDKIYERAQASAEARPYILAVGRIEQRKNIPLLVEAFIKADLPDIDLVIVGSLDMGYDWRPPQDARVHVKSGLSDEALIDLYRGASLFVFPSSAEGFGIPLLDAILFEIPTISSNLTSMPEIGGSVATYFDPDAPGAEGVLADLIGAHFRDRPIRPATQAELGRYRETFSWRRLAREFAAAVDSLGDRH